MPRIFNRGGLTDGQIDARTVKNKIKTEIVPIILENKADIDALRGVVNNQSSDNRDFRREINNLNEKVEGIMKLYTTTESGVAFWKGEGGRKRKRKTKKRKRGKSPKRTKKRKRKRRKKRTRRRR